MLDDLAVDAFAERLAKRFEKVNDRILKDLGGRIADVKSMDPEDLHNLGQLYRFGGSTDKIIAELAKESALAESEVRDLIRTIAADSYADASMFYTAAGKVQIPFAENVFLQQYVKSVQDMTTGTFANFSNTSAIGFRKLGADGKVIYQGLGDTYKDAIDQAVTELSMGVTDFDSAMRSTLRELADSGIRVVDYESGYSRRLDSAVRQNILDSTRAIYQGIQRQVGKEFGSDGVELSAHGGCAADHLAYQGRQYSHAEYNKLQGELERPIGEMNCRHFAHEIIMGISRPAYSDSQLKELERMSSEQKAFEGKEYSRYQATQLQGKIESAMRNSKDRANIAKAAGDDFLRRTEQGRLNILKHKYQDVSEQFDLPYKAERMSVSGFRPVSPTLPKVASAEDTILRQSISFDFLDANGKMNTGLVPSLASATKVKIIAGHGTTTTLRAAERLAKEYGGLAEYWQKKVGTVTGNSYQYEIHWYEGFRKQVEHKFVSRKKL